MAETFYNPLTGLPLEYQRLAETEAMRRRQILRAIRAYDGEAPRAITPRSGEPDDSVRLGWARLIVDKGAHWLFGQDLVVELGDGSTDAEGWLNRAWPMERRMTDLLKLAINGGQSGHVFAKIVATTPYPRLVILDPTTVTPTFSPDDIEEVVRWKIQYSASDPATGRPIVFTQVHERNDAGTWTITDETTDENNRVKTRRVYEWPFELSQIVSCQNLPSPNTFWGEPDLNGEILDLVETAEGLASHTNKMVRLYANPILWINGMSADPNDPGSALDITPGGVVLLPEPDQRLNAVEPGADIAGSLSAYNRVVEDIHSFAHIPKVATDATQGDQIGRASGSAMRFHYSALIERTEVKRRTYGLFVTEIVRRLLLVGGQGEATPKLIWPELVADPMADITRAQALAELGVSQDTVWRTAGISDPSAEMTKVAAMPPAADPIAPAPAAEA